MKRCNKCGLKKDLTEFGKDKKIKDGKRLVCKKCNNADKRSWYQQRKIRGICKFCFRPAENRYALCNKCRVCENNKAKSRHLKAIKEAFDHYGRKCACCGETEPLFLTIDHINNDGNVHRKKERINSGTAIFYWLRKNNYPDGFQVLCRNCNWGKYVNNGRCPHQGGKKKVNSQ